MVERFKEWLAHPYRDDMSAVEWFWFFGLLIVISVGWGLILRSMREVAT